MLLEHLDLQFYRNIDELKLDLHPRLTVLVGDNGMGKTNVLESIHLLSFPRSFRSNKDLELKQWGRDYCRIEGRVRAEEDEYSVVFFYDQKKKLMINSSPVKGLEYVGKFLSVLFAPEDISLLIGAPGLRRAFLDAHLSQVSPTYFQHLLHYNAVVKQRNKLLSRPGASIDELEYWDGQQVLHGSALWVARLDLIESFNRLLDEVDLRIDYVPSLAIETESIVDDFQEKQVSIRERERFVGHSLVGPHRDDWRLLKKGAVDESEAQMDRDLGVYGSRGQQRMGVIELKKSQLQLLHNETKSKAVLLLDDVLSELDADNQQNLIRSLSDQQTVITTASLSDIPRELLEDAWVYEVRRGTLKRQASRDKRQVEILNSNF